jgi:lysophospholipase L1-like esterase
VPFLFGPDKVTMKGEVRQVSVSAFTAGSRTWKWTEVGAGSVTGTGSDVTVSLTGGTGTARGTQPAGQNAGITDENLGKMFTDMTKEGVPARLVVTGVASDGRTTTTGIITPTSLTATADGLQIKGVSNGAGLPQGAQEKVHVSLETPGNGVTKRFVVITGDSIASGEGARYGGTYINPQLTLIPGQSGDKDIFLQSATPSDIDARYKRACEVFDLACVSASADPGTGKLSYKADPGIVYEKGSWERAADGEACHRSKTAPGTWLARWYATQVGEDVESINIACSGATTDNILTDKFKGERPQKDQLKDLADWLPVPYVVNTVGANDIGFERIATQCFLAPVNALAPDVLSGGSFDTSSLTGRLSGLLDYTRYNSKGEVESGNPWFNAGGLCSVKEREGTAKAIQDVRGKIASAIKALHESSPGSRIVQMNYPGLVPPSTKTYLPRQEVWKLWVDQSLTTDGPLDQYAEKHFNMTPEAWPDADPVLDVKVGEPLFDGVVDGNPVNRLVAFHIFSTLSTATPTGESLSSAGLLGNQLAQVWLPAKRPITSLLNYGALMFGFDQDWAAKEVIPGLNKAVLGAVSDVDPAGEFTQTVDVTLALQGRELGTKANDGKRDASDQFNYDPGALLEGVDCQSDPSSPTGCAPGTGPGELPSPDFQRAQFVNNPLVGQSAPSLCPKRDDDSDKCIGELQEALHPNWRGQAALGQCIVAVVTEAFGQSGNACVRSVGTDDFATERTYSNDAGALIEFTLFSPVTMNADPDAVSDQLCLISSPDRYPTEDGRYEKCSSGIDADPRWDAKRWDDGKVRDGGQPAVWR